MSQYYAEHGEIYSPEYNDGVTKQSFKDSCDINLMLKKAMVTGSISHLQKFEEEYGDFYDFDWDETQRKLARGSEMFAELPSEVRREFDQSPAKFFDFVNDPANNGRLAELMPELARPGDYNLDMRSSTPPGSTTEPATVTEPAPASPPEDV